VLGVLTHIPSIWATFLQVAMHIGGALISVTIGMRHRGLAVFAKDMRREGRSVKYFVVFSPVLGFLSGLESPFEAGVGILQ